MIISENDIAKLQRIKCYFKANKIKPKDWMEDFLSELIEKLNGDIQENGEKSFCKCGMLSHITATGICDICKLPFKPK